MNHTNHEEKNTFFRTLKSFDDMHDVEFPQALHGRIMRSIYLRQFRLPLYIINGMLGVNLGLSSYHLWNMVSVRAGQLASGLQAEKIGFGDRALHLSQAIQSVPLDSSLIFVANLALMGAGMYLLYRLSSMLGMARTPIGSGK